MASNPMQRKTRMAFIGGFFVALLIAAIVIAIIFTKYKKVQEELDAKNNIAMKSVYVIQTPIESGGKLNGNLVTKSLPIDIIPSNAATPADLAQYTTEEGIMDTVVGKIKLEKDTVLTKDMIAFVDGEYVYKGKNENGQDQIQRNSSVRMEEYNMLVLPTKLQIGDYIDIRLQMPTGETYIVVSKKYVEDTDATTVWLKMSEEEILSLNNAIVEAYVMKGAKLYADVYMEGGLQEKAKVTYQPSSNVVTLIENDKNIVTTARDALKAQWADSNSAGHRQTVIETQLKNYEENKLQNTEEGISKEIEDLRESRQLYLDELGAY